MEYFSERRVTNKRMIVSRKPCNSVFFATQDINISYFRSLSLIVNILWTFEKYALFGCDHISDYTMIVIWGL